MQLFHIPDGKTESYLCLIPGLTTSHNLTFRNWNAYERGVFFFFFFFNIHNFLFAFQCLFQALFSI